MALNGTEVVILQGVDGAGHPSGKQFNSTTQQIANLGSSVTSNTFNQQISVGTGANMTIALDSYASFNYTINGVTGVKTASGTITAAIQINGVNVTGLNNISISSVVQNVTASALNTVLVGDRVTIVFTANSTALSIELAMQLTRTS